MGKVIIFNGLTVNNSIGSISLENSLPKNIATYFSLSNITPTIEENNAFLSFYKTLKSNNLWDSIVAFYPMFRNLDGCKYSVVGNTLTLPNGCVYNNGLDCTNASEGEGFLRKGFLLNDDSILNTGNLSIYFASPNINIPKAAVFTAIRNTDLSVNTHDLTTDYFNFGLALNINKTNTDFFGINGESYGKDVSGNRVFCYTHEFSDTIAEGKLYSDGIFSGNIGRTFSTSSVPTIYFNVFSAIDVLSDNSRWNANTPISFVMIYKETHSEEQVKIISDAINEIISKIQS